MKKLKLILLASTLLGLFACTPKTTETPKVGYLKNNISQAELNNPTDYKRYYYNCRNSETSSSSVLVSYFPLSLESRKKENFGFYFQLDNGKVQPFDHIENKALNASGTRFEVIYRSYHPIEGAYVNLIAGEGSSIYYKNSTPWLECREG
ncbi:hypothetical protein A1D22_07845 [Pasteurellaceae bacterium LFhippo2]|nr:hypothetical protein [Pasteurellaceae bacterium LFhippo2]